MLIIRCLPKDSEDSESDVRQQLEYRLHLVRLDFEVENHFGSLQEHVANVMAEQG